MERRLLSQGMKVAVKRQTGSRRNRSPARAATIEHLLPYPDRPDRVRVRWPLGGTSVVRIHQIRPAAEKAT